jgi:hypothetical protein
MQRLYIIYAQDVHLFPKSEPFDSSWITLIKTSEIKIKLA